MHAEGTVRPQWQAGLLSLHVLSLHVFAYMALTTVEALRAFCGSTRFMLRMSFQTTSILRGILPTWVP